VLPTKSRLKTASTAPPRRVSSDTLLGSRKELVIVHDGREYRLRLTQNGKLILTASPRDAQPVSETESTDSR
jgi:hemin uptake protein HemP